MKKILFFGMTNINGGIENFSFNYAQNVNGEEFIIDFIDIYDGIVYKEKLSQLGSRVINLTNYRKHPFKAFKEIVNIIKQDKYDVVHYNMNSAVFLLPLIAGKFSGAEKVIAHAHNASSDKGIVKSILHWINKHFIPLFANYYFACSDKAARWFFSDKIIESNRFYIINNAIDVNKFDYNSEIRNDFRKKFKIENDLVVGHVGRFNKQKNHTFLIDIFDKLQHKKENVKLMLVGTGPLEDEIKKKVQTLNISEKVMFMENRNNVNELMQCMDVLVMPSLYEGLSLVTVEAQGSSLPCLLSDTVSKEVKILNATQFLSINQDADKWADAIIKITDRNSRTSVKEQIIEKNFDIYTEANKLKEIYRE